MLYYRKPLLTLDQCNSSLHKINSLSSHFIFEIEDYFCTLGAAAYQHVGKMPLYEKRVVSINRILWTHFELIYIMLKESLESFFGHKVLYPHSQISLPGFHIFEIGKKEGFFGGSPHFDLSFKSISGLPQNVLSDYPEHYSFTLPLQLPKYGSGVNIWDLELSQETEKLSDGERSEICTEENKVYFPYECGELVVFNGYNFHQIAAIDKVIPGDRRITLQGHLLRNSDHFLIYW